MKKINAAPEIPHNDLLDDIPDADDLPDDMKLWAKRRAAETDAPSPEAIAAVLEGDLEEARASSVVTTHAELDILARMNQITGMLVYAQGMEATNKLAKLKLLAELKKEKTYKNMPVKNAEGRIVRPKNFEELCEAFGMARSSVDRDLENIAVFGEGVLLAQKALGIGYRDLRGLRGSMRELPEGERQEVKEIIAEAVASGDKEEFYAALEELGARNTKLARELKEAQRRSKAQEDHQAETTRQVTDLKSRLAQALNPSDETERQTALRDAQTAFTRTLDENCLMARGAVIALCTHVGNTLNTDIGVTSFGDRIVDAALWEDANGRISLLCQAMRGLLLDTGLEVDFAAEYTGELPFVYPAPDAAPEPEEALTSLVIDQETHQ